MDKNINKEEVIKIINALESSIDNISRLKLILVELNKNINKINAQDMTLEFIKIEMKKSSERIIVYSNEKLKREGEVRVIDKLGEIIGNVEKLLESINNEMSIELENFRGIGHNIAVDLSDLINQEKKSDNEDSHSLSNAYLESTKQLGQMETVNESMKNVLNQVNILGLNISAIASRLNKKVKEDEDTLKAYAYEVENINSLIISTANDLRTMFGSIDQTLDTLLKDLYIKVSQLNAVINLSKEDNKVKVLENKAS